MKPSIFVSFALLMSFSVFPQSPLSIFLDPEFEIDQNYIKQEIDFVQYVFDRQEADLHISLIRQILSDNGEKIIVLSRESESGQVDTTTFFNAENSTRLAKKQMLVKKLKQTILPSLIKTGSLDNLSYSVEEPNNQEAKEITDKWNNWVFQAGIIGMTSGESISKTIEGGIKFSAMKTLEQWKFFNASKYYYEKSSFELDDTTTFVNINRFFYNRSRFVRSLDNHWSLGVATDISNSSYSNHKLTTSIKAMAEYSLFEYDRASTKLLKFMYTIGPRYTNYSETTVLGFNHETNIAHEFNAAFSILRDWGDVSFYVFFDQYLHRPEFFSITIGPKASWNITKGLSFECGAHFSHIANRINVPATEIQDEEILLRSRIVDTNFSYFSYFAFNYRFGSSNNNTVNTRFDDYDLSISTSF